MTHFRVAIIGRPNVGKSTLFNRLVGKKLALVDDQPGVTRDRREGEARLGDLRFTVIDTAGLDEEGGAASLNGRMRVQTEAAVADADAVFFLTDSRSGVMPADRHFADLVRRAGKPTILIANKAEGRAGTAGAYEAFDLGLGDPIALSAEHGEGLAELFSALLEALPEATSQDVAADDETRVHQEFEEEDGSELDVTKPVRIAVVGRPNAGKSTLLNAILGEDRLLTGPEPGITRDSIGLTFEWHGRSLKLFDTAGLRKRARIDDKLEKLAAADALRAAKFAEVVILLLDATIPFEKQDLTIAALVEREGRGLVIGLNKWDLIESRGATLSTLREDADRLLPQVKGMPVVPVSGLNGQGLDKLIDAALQVQDVWNRRIATARLNRWLNGVIDQTPPPAVSGRRIKLRYMTQPKARPPTFVLFGNQLTDLPTSYQRFLVNGLREAFDLPGVPIRLTLKQGENPYDKRRGGRR
ncbi:ribosome biogenesis GTPase Der [Lichenifustis flavocetrariae]|uniref:GTPase Der n=1 Tax=Lichenifustis flavocetrariae TaxID=2949735 RepID=A0AA41YSZ8_9HYPH|nr:ribosome biogenesis GTPase Der [Lichenifustis flavocetrariae]MCW6507599.1 ribosome biogenesis GTPase Der [Lichenifustis flavocetrariae]